MKSLFQVHVTNSNIFVTVFHRFSQTFIDIREKEKKRGARGLITIPNTKYDQMLGLPMDINMTDESSTDVPNESGGQIKAEDLLDLQEKITKEILSSKLDENDMQDLQVNMTIFCSSFNQK